ncbi:MAG: diguanylate cyclase [Arcobacteraceae bacterium]|nr:diguanylate cyclase [Arcobacteraceae bacterium]
MPSINNKLLKKVKVLYVEDEIEIQNVTTEALSLIFSEIIPASNGEEALELYHEHGDFDIIVTDINMPKMDGMELIRHIRENDKSFPISITTAYTEIEFLQEAIDMNVNGYILKPVNLKKLITTIYQAVEARMLRKELEELNSVLISQLKEKTFELNSILNSQDNLVVVSNGDKVHTVNNNFLEFVNKRNIDEFNNDIKQICHLFIKEEGYYYVDNFNNLCCLSDAQSFQNKDILVKIRNSHNTFNIFKLNMTTYEFNGTHYVLTLTDITKLKKQADLLEYQATHDVLTKLANRQKFNKELQSEIQRSIRYENNFIIAMFDIDHFKKVNDTYGHDVGDEVLTNLAKTIQNVLRDTDTIARWGGEEFMILLSETNMENGLKTIEKIRKLIESSTFSSKLKNPITCSFGITSYLKNDNIDIILKRIDIALYKAKENGRNKIEQA